MINYESLFNLSYGLYLVCSGDSESGDGFVSNTVFQVTAEPPMFASCCNKDNYTAEFIKKYGAFSVSILHLDASSDLIGRFGYKSGREVDKLDGMHVRYGETGVPIVLNDSLAYLECKVVQTIDVGTHYLFIAQLLNAESLDAAVHDPLTYAHYRRVKKGFAPKNAPTYIDKSKLAEKPEKTGLKKYECAACGYIYDEAEEPVRFADLPNDWVCPVCGSEKSDFFEVD